jgi:UrcA family protein
MFKHIRSGKPRIPKTPVLEDHDPNTNTGANAYARSSRSTVLCATMLLGLSQMVPTVVPADPHATGAPETRTARVALADLDLTTPEGARVARDRMQEAARRLCVQLAESRDVGRSWHLHACIDATLASALRQIGSPALASATDSRAKLGDVRK